MQLGNPGCDDWPDMQWADVWLCTSSFLTALAGYPQRKARKADPGQLAAPRDGLIASRPIARWRRNGGG
ncbi:hypothetical protein [Nitrobacter sp.]|uniref:hypothetical protein n=1 Tax=Nitrobacter sp. TaxID=29420 RepID=UPI0025D67CDD|nr:hypothetical protein [Nitrobacter sp.]